jgi:glycosyltransferase involved in cell wall biosynthesis
MTQFWANFRNCSYDEDKAYEEFVEVVGQASKIIVSTHAERKRIVNVVPSLGERVVSIPFFQPYLREFVSPEEIRMKHQTNRIGIMFVGRESDRKGYDLFQSAISNLTRFDGVSVSIFGQSTTTLNSKNLNIEFFPKGDRALVLSEMRRNHILFHPARFESYGFVITEAMANGMAVIAPAWEVQSELLDYGSAGELVFPQIFDCFHALERMISDSETRTVLALRAYYRWEEKYHPGVVADAWKTMLNNL